MPENGVGVHTDPFSLDSRFAGQKTLLSVLHEMLTCCNAIPSSAVARGQVGFVSHEFDVAIATDAIDCEHTSSDRCRWVYGSQSTGADPEGK